MHTIHPISPPKYAHPSHAPQENSTNKVSIISKVNQKRHLRNPTRLPLPIPPALSNIYIPKRNTKKKNKKKELKIREPNHPLDIDLHPQPQKTGIAILCIV